MGVFTRRSRLIVDVPASMKARIVEHYIPFAPKVTVAGNRRVYVWAAQDIPKPDPEPLAPDSSYGEGLVVATPRTWGDIARWYAGLARDRYTLTPAIEQQLATVVKDAKTLDDSIRAVHRWVAQDFRYVSISLGIWGYQPHDPETVFTNKYGDWKDKATFFIALLRTMGVTAYPVLLSAFGGIDPSVPSAHQFDHMIAAVQRPGGGYTFTDLTADLVPFGLLPPQEMGQFGLVVHPDGRGEEVTFPVESAAQDRASVNLDGTLSTDGMFTGRWTSSVSGALQIGLRGSMSRSTKLDSTQRARMTLAITGAIVEGATGDSLQLFDGRDLRAEPRVSVAVRNGHMATNSGGAEILTIPIRDFASPRALAALEARGPRKLPIDAAKVWGPHENTEDFRVTLPAGWHARLPKNVRDTSAFGSYTATYSQTGRDLRVTRTISGTSGVLPASRIGDLITWLKGLSSEDVKYIVLDTGS